VQTCLRSGANDLGGTLMDETITRSAGASHGQEMTPAEMESLIRSLGRVPRQRDTLYRTVPQERYLASFGATRGSDASPSAPSISSARKFYCSNIDTNL
jgi:FO synthase